MSNYIVYMHKNKINGKVYIGITNNHRRRWRYNGIEYKPHKKENQNRMFWNAIQKYGWKSFENIVLENELSFENAIKREKYYIKLYNSTNKIYGYNISLGGSGGVIYSEHPRGMQGKSQSENQKTRHKIWASDKDNNCMTNGKVVWGKTHDHPKGMEGKKHTEEHKKRMGENLSRSKHPCARIFIATMNNTELEFGSSGDCMDYYGISTTLFYNLLRSGTPFIVSDNNRWKNKQKHLAGLSIKYKN